MPDDDLPDEQFEALLAYLRDERGADFTGYKRPSLTRLVNRRMRSAGVASYGEYVDLLQVEPSELAALLDVLLINVTAVFRDPEAWDELARTLLPEVLGQVDPDEPIRVWSAACASVRTFPPSRSPRCARPMRSTKRSTRRCCSSPSGRAVSAKCATA